MLRTKIPGYQKISWSKLSVIVYVLRQNCRAAGWSWDTKNTNAMDKNTGISKNIVVKGGHELENVRLHLFRVTISSV
jgi:hypothetical protein